MATATPETTSVELRCPVGAKRLLAVMKLSQEQPPKIVEGNLLELACRDCRTVVATQAGGKPKLVLHRFNVIGELVNSLIEWD